MAAPPSKSSGQTGSASKSNNPDAATGQTTARRKEALRVFAIAAENHRRGRMDDALRGYARALSIDATIPDIYNNMGVALRAQGKLEAAIACYRRSLALKPGNPGVYSNMGNALRETGKLDTALLSHQQAVKLAPKSPEAVYNMGLSLRDLGQHDKALKCFDRALSIKPDYVDCHWDHALSLLMKGDLEAGFAEYEWRWKLDRARPADYGKPTWDGSDPAGKIILLHHEQGFGDIIQFARYIPIVAAMGATVIVECQPELVRLLESVEGASTVIERGKPLPDYHLVAPLMSLAHILGTTLTTVPDTVPYVKAPELHGGHLPITAEDKVKVGICWAGKPTHKNDRNRSCPFNHFIDIMGLPGLAFFSLQKGPRVQDLKARACDALAVDMGSRVEDFADSAAVIEQLDLVITVDTAVAHLAGALGKPVWVLLPFISDWRWMIEGDTSPWYPSAKLFRQDKLGDWDGVFAEVRKSLQAITEPDSPAKPTKKQAAG